jgi:hypothetical protein
MREAAKFLDISRRRLGDYFLNQSDAPINGYLLSKVTDTLSTYVVSKQSRAIEVINVDTNEVATYPSFTLAAKALNISPASISVYLRKGRTKPFKGKYKFKLI